MPTNEERREVAERLRGGYDVVNDANHYWLNGTLFGLDICARSEERVRDGLRKLAECIEPEPERTCRNLSEYQDCDCFTCSNCGESYEIKRLEYNIDEYCTIDDAIRALDYDSCDCDVFYCLNCGSELVDDELHDQ